MDRARDSPDSRIPCNNSDSNAARVLEEHLTTTNPSPLGVMYTLHPQCHIPEAACLPINSTYPIFNCHAHSFVRPFACLSRLLQQYGTLAASRALPRIPPPPPAHHAQGAPSYLAPPVPTSPVLVSRCRHLSLSPAYARHLHPLQPQIRARHRRAQPAFLLDNRLGPVTRCSVPCFHDSRGDRASWCFSPVTTTNRQCC